MKLLGLVLIVLLLFPVLPLLLVGLSMPSLGRPTTLPTDQRLATAEGTWRFEDAGTGDHALVLLHGFNQGLEQWDAVWAGLAACPVRRLRVDLPGFAGSRFTGAEFGLPSQATRLLALLQARGVHRVTLAGVSMGGSLAAWFAAKYPGRVSQVALFAPSGYPDALTHPGLFGLLVKPGPLNRAASRVADTWLFAQLFPRSAALQALTVTASYGAPWAEALPRIEAPTLVVWSRLDPVADAGTAESVVRLIPRGRLLWLDAGAGHSAPNTRPERVAGLLCRLAQGQSPAEVIAPQL
ncbi:MAG: alpha/beta hydrolase [Steroidobacteraceae bacterium]